ncbi:hypothetical protein TeGR_g8730 [Tetraparma gracilis]|uniref:ADP,ATP carrier protein n=1 Tax=Tetraparma gracilis TaxID=2962635 RepID=A0ABQ6MZ92_9STRA|nr:hypothetical protein TeGR_g8730 [Tetraparma gracilis]
MPPPGGASPGGASPGPSSLRQAIFPISRAELPKFLLLASVKFFVVWALTVTRDTKDTLVVTQAGAEAIAFMKVYLVLPAAVLFTASYNALATKLRGRRNLLFYCTLAPFFLFFLAFDLFIYPSRASLQPPLALVEAYLGPGVLAKIVANWTSALFYVVAEIYSSASIGILFWQVANEVVPVEQARRFYPLFGQMSSLAPVCAGQYVVRYSSRAGSFEGSLHRLTAGTTACGIAIAACYHAGNKYIERTEPHLLAPKKPSSATSKAKKKEKMSMSESARFLASSPYLRLMATLVVSYGLSINLTEIIWKSLVKKQYPDPLDYSRFMGAFSSSVGAATFFVIFLGSNIIKFLGWRAGALMTPGIMMLLAVPFFTCIIAGVDSDRTLKAAVTLGMVQSLLSKATKYALFDPTTQMAYIPLDEESKVKGKAAIDVLGSRIGKSGGSLVQQALVLWFGSILQAAPAVMLVYYAVLGSWWVSANRLSYMFHDLSAGKKIKNS